MKMAPSTKHVPGEDVESEVLPPQISADFPITPTLAELRGLSVTGSVIATYADVVRSNAANPGTGFPVDPRPDQIRIWLPLNHDWAE